MQKMNLIFQIFQETVRNLNLKLEDIFVSLMELSDLDSFRDVLFYKLTPWLYRLKNRSLKEPVFPLNGIR